MASDTGLSDVKKQLRTNREQLSNMAKHGLCSGKLPKGSAYIARIGQKLGKLLEESTLVAKGRITASDLFAIQSAIRWERHALLAQRWLRLSFAELDHDQRLVHSREIARASSERDKAIRSLGLESGAVGGRTIDILLPPLSALQQDEAKDQPDPPASGQA